MRMRTIATPLWLVLNRMELESWHLIFICLVITALLECFFISIFIYHYRNQCRYGIPKSKSTNSTNTGLGIELSQDELDHQVQVPNPSFGTLVVNHKPKNWDAMPIDSTGKEKLVHLVPLTAGSPEYNNVESQFNKTMTKGNNYNQIVSIQRIQHPGLYHQYIVKKREMDKRNPQGHRNEHWLFHGTSPDTLDKINNQGFNRSFAGKNATAYGKGVYFARDSSYSNGYVSPDGNGYRYMYLAWVLTGEYTKGESYMVVPPPKNPQINQHVPFDSTVDNVTNPSIFVVYNDPQTYPAYIIKYIK